MRTLAAAANPDGRGFSLLLSPALWVSLVLYLALSAQYEPSTAWWAQNSANLRFLERPDLVRALEGHPAVWPPAFPLLLRAARAVAIQPSVVNGLLWCLVLVGLLHYLRRYCANVAPWIPCLVASGAGVVHHHTRQFTSETLFVVCSLFALLVVVRFVDRPGTRGLILLGCTSGVACMARYFGLVWLVPTIALCIAFSRHEGRVKKLLHAGTYLLMVAVICAPWVGYAYGRTGYLAGEDRFHLEAREEWFPRSDWHLLSLPYSLRLSGRALYLDLFSFDRFGTPERINHQALALDGPETTVAAGVAGSALAAVALLLPVLWRARREALEQLNKRSPGTISLLFFASYYAVLFAIWPNSNNDPLNSRFLFPAHVFGLLFCCSLYSFVKEHTHAFYQRLPLLAIVALLLAANAVRVVRLVT